MRLLLNQRGGEVKATEEVFKTAGGNTQWGKGDVAPLNHYGGDVKVTVKVVKCNF